MPILTSAASEGSASVFVGRYRGDVFAERVERIFELNRLLVFRSGPIPRILGVLLIVGCPGDPAERVTTQLFPAYEQMVKLLIMVGLGELGIIRSLLIKDATVDPPDA